MTVNTEIRAGVPALGLALTTAGTAAAGVAAWLAQARPSRLIGGGSWSPDQATEVALGRSFDVVIHLHKVTAARLLP
ncbi:hypothetical protein [Nonomuraea rhodomycinica]|uniref:Uncharacterized protein n=1 Tax=Nonomuraea rhodomycinica TaxID=1712872 RepID=A0A7Y6IUZ0_9ACTN|nr:hypothetical protein [Nonomuraea rhodomycinica]NUW44891.1 hypothetical protein [Nonomuraea rhodomycinica]